jgi:O-antigen ligase
MQSAIEEISAKNGRFQSILLSGFGALVLACIFLYVTSNLYYPLLIPLICLVGMLVVAYPTSLMYLFFISFFLGIHLLTRFDYLFIDMPHLVLPLLFVGFLSRYLLPRGDDCIHTHIPVPAFLSLLVFMALASVSFFLNVGHHHLRNTAISLWYLLNLACLVGGIRFFSLSWVKEFKERVVVLVIVLSAMEIPVMAFQMMHLKDYSVGTLQKITGTFTSHHAMLANMMTFSLGFCLYKLLDAASVSRKVVYGSLSFLFLNMIIFSGSRSNLIGIFAATAILALLRLRLKPLSLSYIFLGIVFMFLLFQFSPLHHLVSGTVKSSETGTLDYSSLGRLYIWKGATDHFLKAPIIEKAFGVGIANFPTIQFSTFIFDLKFASGAHDNFLHVLLETGVVGFVSFMTYFIVVLVLLYQQGKKDHLALAYFFITLALLVSGITQETFWFQPAFGLLWLFHTSLLALILDRYKHE